jgi:hypothetical protein
MAANIAKLPELSRPPADVRNQNCGLASQG